MFFADSVLTLFLISFLDPGLALIAHLQARTVGRSHLAVLLVALVTSALMKTSRQQTGANSYRDLDMLCNGLSLYSRCLVSIEYQSFYL